MTLRIADLCLGTDKDWKVGKTKIFLKVRFHGLLETIGRGEGVFHPASALSPAGLWVHLAIGARIVGPIMGIWNLDRKEVVERQGNRENVPREPSRKVK